MKQKSDSQFNSKSTALTELLKEVVTLNKQNLELDYDISYEIHMNPIKQLLPKIGLISGSYKINQISSLAKNSYKVFGTKGNGNGQFSNPYGIALTNEAILVSDKKLHCIQKFNLNGDFISKFGSKGTQNGKFSSPHGLTVDKNGNIYVAELTNHRIQIFNSNFLFIRCLGSKGTGNGEFDRPIAVTIDHEDRVIVLDHGNNRIQIFDSALHFVCKFGCKGNNNGELANPRGIAVNSKGEIIVADCSNSLIQIFDRTGKFIQKFATSFPYGVAVDKFDRIYVTQFTHCIQIFDSNGISLLRFGSKGNVEQQFNHPRGIAVDGDCIIVADEDNQRIHLIPKKL
jgi:tripartite motif-containing protein 71